LSQGYPTVTDSLGKVLISLHNYMSYQYQTWTIAAAKSYAEQDYQYVLKGEQNTGWYALDTEGGPDPQSSTCNGPGGTTSGCPPDDILPGSAGYANVSLTYIQMLTQLFDSNNPRIGWVWWPAGTWTDTPCAGTYGALQPAYCPGSTGYSGGVGWGNLLQYMPVNGTSTPPTSPPPSTQPPNKQPGSGGTCLLCSLNAPLPTLLVLTIGIASGLLIVAGLYFARNRSKEKRTSVLARASLSASSQI
jgi:hypothetical protein